MTCLSNIAEKKAKLSPKYLILVVDDNCAHIISQLLKPYELIQVANIYQIEKLNKKNKRYPDSDVIFFIEPSQPESLKLLLDNFLPDEEDEFDYD